MPTKGEQDYLKALYHLSKGSTDTIVNVSRIAAYLGLAPASVTEMLKRMEKNGLVLYQAYKGVQLTEKGKEQALKIIRKHRLWEYFLVHILKIPWEEVHAIAEQLEHVESERLIEHLDRFLGFPRFDPHGDPIPDKEGKMEIRPTVCLSEVPVGAMVEVLALKDQSSAFLQYLNQIGVRIGTRMQVHTKNAYDQSCIVIMDNGSKQVLSYKVSKNLLVQLL